MYYYIVNPAAGGGRINKIQDKLKSLLKEKKIDGELVKSIGKNDAYKIAKLAVKRGFTNIVAVGGNSTVSEVVNALIDAPNSVLGIIPIGTNNTLAKVLGISDWEKGVYILAQRRIRTIDLGKVNDSFFITSLEIGFETEILKDRQNISPLKKLTFKKDVLAKIFSFKPFEATIKFDGKFSIDSKIFNFSVFNTRFLKNKEEFFLNDGKLTSLLVPHQATLSLLKNFSKIASFSYETLPFISCFRAKNIHIDTGKIPQRVFADAEYVGTTPVEVSVSSKKLKVIVSKDRKFD